MWVIVRPLPYVQDVTAARRFLVRTAEVLCGVADRWDVSARLVGCGAQGTGRCLAELSHAWDERWGTQVWR